MADPVEIVQLYRMTRKNTKWEFDSRVIVEVEDRKFIKLARAAHGFAKLVFDECDHIPSPLPKEYSLTASKGYADLVKRRNDIQAEYLKQKELDNIPALFRDSAVTPQKSKRTSRAALIEARKNPEAITLKLPGTKDEDGNDAEIEVLRPVHPDDVIAIIMEPAAVGYMIDYLQQGGWSSDLIAKKRKHVPSDAPRGVWARKHKKTGEYRYQLAIKNDNGRKSVRNLTDGASWGMQEESADSPGGTGQQEKDHDEDEEANESDDNNPASVDECEGDGNHVATNEPEADIVVKPRQLYPMFRAKA